MKISLFQGVLIGIFIFAALVGLFTFATYSNKGSGSDAIGTITIWGTLPRDDIAAMLQQVMQADTSVKDVAYVQKDPNTLPTELASAIATGSGPDLVLASQENLYALSKFITPLPTSTLPPKDFTSTFIDEANLFAVPGNQGYFGVPFLVDPLVLFWNNDILSSSGIAKPPATWEELTGLVSRVAVLSPTKQITRGLIGLGTYDNVHNARGILSALFLQTGVPISTYTASGNVSADLGLRSNGGQSPGLSVLGFYTIFADPSKVSYTWNGSLPDSQQQFLKGNLGLYIGYASEARFLAAANSNLSLNVSPLPQPGTAKTTTTYGLVYAFMIPRGAKNADGALKAAALFSTLTEQSVSAQATGLAPVVREVLATLPDNPVASVAYSGALYAKGWLSPQPSDVDHVFSSMIGDMVTGRLTPDADLSRTEAALGALLQK